MQFHDLMKKDLDKLEEEIAMLIPKKPSSVYGMILPYIQRGGKRIRPLFSLLCCAALTRNKMIKNQVIKLATIIELFHNFTLIHDDIEDDSKIRRGQPTLHITYGLPIALNSGDGLYTIILEALVKLSINPIKLIELQKMYLTSFRRLVEGQGIELYWHKKNHFNISEQEYLAMVSGKTAALIGLSCEIVPFINGSNKKLRTAFRMFGENLGLAFQIQDDVLNVIGNFKKYKKEIGGDITEGKRTLMVIHTLAKSNKEENKRLKEILSSHSSNKNDINYVLSLFIKYNAIDHAKKKADYLIKKAKHELVFLPDSKEKKMLFSICDFVVKRQI